MPLLALALRAAIATVVPRTLESETKEGYELACTIADDTWNRHRLDLLQSGGRAFVAPDGVGKPAIYRTRIELRVTKDGTGKLAGMSASEKLIENPGYGYGTSFVEIGGNKGRAIIKVSEVSAKQFAISIVYASGLESTPFAGFCDVKVIPQSPLTEVETAEYLRNPYGLPNR
ncbi:hypothetical protein ACFO0A_14770 [Novosphingobium tardum]|uniref:Uncharacterized protein n=1 Tax=Novosphingobium tardum TaxID=1538021 RepID=A0ABV8RT36_9SPHN